MKKLVSIVTLGALALAFPTSGFAAEKKAKAAPAAPAAPAATAPTPAEGAKKPAEAKAPGEPKVMGMYVKVDAIDEKGMNFTHKNKDGKEVKFTLTDKTEIKNGDAPAKLADIKVGDTVSGSRLKKSDTEYEVVKITKFGIAPPKEKKPEGEKKPEAAKKPEEKKQ